MGVRQSRRTRGFENPQPVIRDALHLAMDASLQEAPLPVGWEQSYCPKGNLYFIDHINKRTSVHDPRRRRNRTKKTFKPPPYEWNFYSKSQHFRALLHQRMHDEGQLTIEVNRNVMFEDAFALINNLDNETLTRRLNIKFEGEKGLDYGGMSREWFLSLSADILSEKHGLFKRVGYEFTIHPDSQNVPNYYEKFKFVGKTIGMALYHSKLLHSYFILPFYKLLLSKELEFNDLKYYNVQIWKSLLYIKTNTISPDMGLTFSVEMEVFEKGQKTHKTKELIEGGAEIYVDEVNKHEYIKLMFEHYLECAKPQMDAIKEGIAFFVPLDILQELFEPEELPTLIGGISEIDVKDLEENIEYQGGYTSSQQIIVWFLEILKNMSQDELKMLLQFVTGTHKVPIGGFSRLYGTNGPQKFAINKIAKDGLPAAHSCFNRLDLPEYSDKDTLKNKLFYAIRETKGFDIE